MEREELGAALREHAYLEGDFVLRSGRRSRYYLDKYRFETRPDLLGPLGRLIAEAVQEFEPEASRLAAKIVEYREQHPGRPVHLIGHSGGGGMRDWAMNRSTWSMRGGRGGVPVSAHQLVTLPSLRRTVTRPWVGSLRV